jgi:hypothetical protein
MTAADRQLRAGIRAGLVRVEFTAPIGPRSWVVTISNGSGVKRATVTAGAYSTACRWAGEWAATVGAGWSFTSAEPV